GVVHGHAGRRDARRVLVVEPGGVTGVDAGEDAARRAPGVVDLAVLEVVLSPAAKRVLVALRVAEGRPFEPDGGVVLVDLVVRAVGGGGAALPEDAALLEEVAASVVVAGVELVGGRV